jgi:hypothetical protein
MSNEGNNIELEPDLAPAQSSLGFNIDEVKIRRIQNDRLLMVAVDVDLVYDPVNKST